MSNLGLNSSLLSQMPESFSPAEQLMADLKQLAQDVKSGDLPALQQDYVTLTRDLADAPASGSASAAETGVIVSLLSDILSGPIAPANIPTPIIPPDPGFNYIDPTPARRTTPQDAAAPMDLLDDGPASPALVNSAPQLIASKVVPQANIVDHNSQPQALAMQAQSTDASLASPATPMRTANSPVPLSVSTNEVDQAAATLVTASSSGQVNQVLPNLGADATAVFPWNLYDWQLSSNRFQSVPIETLRKRKGPRGSATRTFSRRRKP